MCHAGHSTDTLHNYIICKVTGEEVNFSSVTLTRHLFDKFSQRSLPSLLAMWVITELHGLSPVIALDYHRNHRAMRKVDAV